MASLEVRNYQDPEEKNIKDEWKEVTDNGESTVEVTPEIEKETIESLKLMQSIEEKFQALWSNELNDYKGLLHEYKSIKDDIQKKMDEDPVFQKIMKEYWSKLDANNARENKENPEIGEKEIKQVEAAKKVLNSTNYLNESQMAALMTTVQAIKDRLSKVSKELWLA